MTKSVIFGVVTKQYSKNTTAMSMVFRFRMLSDENDNFVRDYEVPYDMTLLDFHNFILHKIVFVYIIRQYHTKFLF